MPKRLTARNWRALVLPFVLLGGMGLCSPAAWAQTTNLVVTRAQDDTGTAGNCTPQTTPNKGTDAACTLRDALVYAANGGTNSITFDSTAFADPQTITLPNGALNIPSNTSIAGPTTGSGTTLTNLVTVSAAGTPEPFSVGLGLTASIANLNFESANSATSVGGIIYNNGTLTVTGSTFSGNVANSGGAIYNEGTLAVANSTFSGNSDAIYGAAIWNGGTLTVTASTFSGNSALGSGGAIYNETGTLTVTNSTFSGNSGVFGGAIVNWGSLTVTDSSFSGNSASQSGGAIDNIGTLTMTNSTCTGNYVSSSGQGGGCMFSDPSSTSATVANSIVSGNWEGTATSVSGYDDLYDTDSKVSYSNNDSVVGCYITGGILCSPPNPPLNLAPLGNYGGLTQTMIPLPGSPAICQGVKAKLASGVSTDQRGYPNTNTTYPAYTTNTPCVDAGAVQTNYSMAFTATSPSYIPPANAIVAGENFQAAVTLDESNAPFDGVTIPLALTPTTSTLTGGSAITGVVNGVHGVANYTLDVNQAGTDTLTANLTLNSLVTPPGSSTPGLALTASSASFAVVQDAAVISLSSSATAILLGNSVTFTATATSYSGLITPTGTVNFMADGSSLGSVALNNGTASLTISTLAAGSHSITVVYGGDNNFPSGATSTALTETVQDFQLSGGMSVTVQPGGVASYQVQVSPTNGSTLPGAITFTLSGLPAGTSYTVTPNPLAAGSGATTVTVQVQTPLSARLRRTWGGGLIFATALLPIAGMVRRRGRRRTRSFLLLLLAAIVLVGMWGCSGSGYNSQSKSQPAAQTYTMQLNATSGALTHSTNLTLTVQ